MRNNENQMSKDLLAVRSDKELSARFSERLNEAMESQGLTQWALADMTFTTQGAVWKWLHGKPPSPSALILLSEKLRISTAYLLCKTDDPTPKKNDVGVCISGIKPTDYQCLLNIIESQARTIENLSKTKEGNQP